MRQGALILLKFRLVGAIVDLREEGAALDDLAFGEAYAHQQPVDLRLHRHRIERCDRPQLVQDDADVAGADGRHADGLRRVLGAVTAGLRRRRGTVRP
jgi:hypothetical protein